MPPASGDHRGAETELNSGLIFVQDGPTSQDASGLATGFAAAMQAHEFGAPAQVEQGSLFGQEPADPHGVGDLADEVAEHRGRGRPAGSRNKSTEQWTRFLQTRYRSPLIGLAEVAQMTPAQLQGALGGEPREGSKGGIALPDCLRLIMQAQSLLAPYLHQKQPVAIDAGGTGMMTVVINTGSGSESTTTITAGPIEESEQNQGVTIDAEILSETGGRSE
jgi:hypothetical protein